ncbi:hypothetical protein ABZ135_37315 [Streptomyces sp. NPDC006339]|uniref:hypothetical protein n=1 Tax=Streptomyces sp. NPDC006339 TaxID=3156755 RepID=UPI0033A4D2FC
MTDHESAGTPPGTEPAPAADGSPAGPAGRFLARIALGARHLAAGLRHILTTGHQSDEEIRRTLVLRQLEAHDAVRDTAREELDAVRRRITRLELAGAEEGWTPEQRQQVRMLREERRRREAAARDMGRVPFVPVQPTADQIRRARHKGSTVRLLGLLAFLAALSWLLVQRPALLAPAALAALIWLWWSGGHPPVLAQRPVPDRLLARPELDPDAAPAALTAAPGQDDDQDQDTDLRHVTTADEATARIAAALAKRKVHVRSVAPAVRTAYGWQADLTLREGTVADVVAVLRRLDTDFRVGTGRTLAEGSTDDSAIVTLRVLTSDPFANPPAPPVRPPLSCSILDPVSDIVSLDGEPTPLYLAGTSVLAVAVMGGGKSSLVRDLADYVTACRDAVAVDIDPTGRGLGPLRRAALRTAYTPEAAEAELRRLLAEARRRTADLGETEDVWQVTPTTPAIVAFLDEYAQLTPEGKGLAIEVLRIARKARISLVVCTQDATADVMGDAVADVFPIRVLMPCRKADIGVTLWPSAVSEGWTAHHLTPGDDHAPHDAGRCFIWAPGHKRPILRYVPHIAPHDALQRAQERLDAGLPTLTATDGPQAAQAAAQPIVAVMLDAFAAAGAEELTVAELLDALAAVDPGHWTQWDTRPDRLAMGGREIKRALKDAGLPPVPTVRSKLPGRPSAYRLQDLKSALDETG